jgi:hypothetical protein
LDLGDATGSDVPQTRHEQNTRSGAGDAAGDALKQTYGRPHDHSLDKEASYARVLRCNALAMIIRRVPPTSSRPRPYAPPRKVVSGRSCQS